MYVCGVRVCASISSSVSSEVQLLPVCRPELLIDASEPSVHLLSKISSWVQTAGGGALLVG